MMSLHSILRRFLPAVLPGVMAFSMAPAASDLPPVRPKVPSIHIPRLEAPPRLEDFMGMAPAEHLAGTMTMVTGFTQREPEDGQPASEKTHVYLGYDSTHLYAVFVAFDEEPELMRANLSPRERVFGDETVEIQLDTYKDQRRAFTFLTNAYGVQWDAMWTEGKGFDDSFDTVWSSEGRLTDSGYVVHMAIPFRSLRFTPDEIQEWGVILVRDIARNNETSFWPPVSDSIEGRLNQAGSLNGLKEISPGRNFQVIPYATGRSFETLNEVDGEPVLERTDGEATLGLDAKMVLRDSLALDLTVNPDFSQVESDQPQVTVNQRFEVFFPERRPFFLENAQLFETPLNLVFTRRIGEPRGGARLTGKVGGTSIGSLLIDDEAPGKSVAPDDPLSGENAAFGILRVAQDIGRQSSLGMLYTERRLSDGVNRVGALDGRVKFDDHWVGEFQAVTSKTNQDDGTSLEGPAYRLEARREGRHWNSRIRYVDIDPDFRTDVGFVPRVDIRNLWQSTGYTFRPEGERLVSWEPQLFTQISHDHEGTRLDTNINPSINIDFRGQHEMSLFGNWSRERLREQDFDTLDEDADFSRDSYGVFVRTRLADPVDLRFRFAIGDGINFSPLEGLPPAAADRQNGNLTLTLRGWSRLRVDNSFLYSRLADPVSGSEIFSNSIFRSQWNWQFTRKASVRAILQLERLNTNDGFTELEQERNFNADLLFTYRVNPWTAVYAGYNTNYSNLEIIQGPDGGELGRTSQADFNDARQFFVKVSYLFRL